MSNNHRNEDQTSSPSPDQGLGKSLTPQLSGRPFGRALFLAFLPCFLWPPLTVVLEKLLAFSSRAASQVSFPLVIFASVILYPVCFPKRSRFFRAFIALLAGAALLCCAWVLWVIIVFTFIKLTGGGVPLPT